MFGLFGKRFGQRAGKKFRLEVERMCNFIILVTIAILITIVILGIRSVLVRRFNRQKVNYLSIALIGLSLITIGTWCFYWRVHSDQADLCGEAELKVLALEEKWVTIDGKSHYLLIIQNSTCQIVASHKFIGYNGTCFDVKILQPNVVTISRCGEVRIEPIILKLEHDLFDCDLYFKINENYQLIEQTI